MDGSDDIWYPTVDDVLTIHRDIVAEYTDTEAGVRSEDDIDYALGFVRDGHFGERPDTVHDKAYHLLRLLTANHPFVDANKRTALDTTAAFYSLNGREFGFDTRVRGILREFAEDASTVEQDGVVAYLRETTTPASVEADSRTELVRRVAERNRDHHRDVYDALEHE